MTLSMCSVPRICRCAAGASEERDRKSTRLNSSHGYISYAVFCLKKKKTHATRREHGPTPIHSRSLTQRLSPLPPRPHSYQRLERPVSVTILTQRSLATFATSPRT